MGRNVTVLWGKNFTNGGNIIKKYEENKLT